MKKIILITIAALTLLGCAFPQPVTNINARVKALEVKNIADSVSFSTDTMKVGIITTQPGNSSINLMGDFYFEEPGDISAGDINLNNLTASSSISTENLSVTGNVATDLNVLKGIVAQEDILTGNNIIGQRVYAINSVTATDSLKAQNIIAGYKLGSDVVIANNITAVEEVVASGLISETGFISGNITVGSLTIIGSSEPKEAVEPPNYLGQIAVDGTGFMYIATADSGDTLWTPLSRNFSEVIVADSSGAKTFNLSKNCYPGTSRVYVNGVRQRIGEEYRENAYNSITFYDPTPNPGDVIIIDYQY